MGKGIKSKAAGWLAVLLLLAQGGCGQARAPAPGSGAVRGEGPEPPPVSAETRPAENLPDAPSAAPCFFDDLCGDVLRQAGAAGEENPFEQIRLAYLYVVTNTHYIPLLNETLRESWRGLDFCGKAPSAYQAEALGPLYYGLGSCENYAAALLVLLRHMGFGAFYVTGLTYSVEGALVDHAWAMVRVRGRWYHIDPQLEDNVTHDGVVRWRYWLKGDEEFSAHHVWGAALERPDAYALALPACPASANPPALEVRIEKPPRPDLPAAQQTAAALAAQGGANRGLEIDGTLPPLPRDM